MCVNIYIYIHLPPQLEQPPLSEWDLLAPLLGAAPGGLLRQLLLHLR